MKIAYFPDQTALQSEPVWRAFLSGCGMTPVENSMTADAAVIWSVLWNGRMLKNESVYNHYRSQNKPVFILEVGSLKRGITWKVSANNLTAEGIYGNQTNLDKSRDKKLEVYLQDFSHTRRPEILIATQHHKSLQWKGQPPVSEWLNFTIEKIRSYTDRRIVIRPHPRAPIHLVTDPLIKIQHPIKLPDTYDKYDIDYNYHCVVNHNSGVSIQAGIAGVPICCGDNSLAAEISTPLLAIDTPLEMDRRPWFERILHTEWTVDEIKQGIPQRRIINDLT